MVFSSLIFLFMFLPALLFLYYAAPAFLKNTVLLIASLFFYAWGETYYTAIMLVSIALNYGFGLLIDRYRGQSRARMVLAIAITTNLALLGFFKYANFFVDNLNLALATFHLPLLKLAAIHLPIGISFFTFHALSYMIDVYRRAAAVQRDPFRLALYISLFPQLVAGPIVRYQHVADQLTARHIEIDEFAEGIRRFLQGLGKKVLLANVFAYPVDQIFALKPEALSPGLAWFATLCYTLQIYYDFSGYSDMAIGLGHMFGFTFRENFEWPYASQNIREFWRRWHISLSTWFRDYLYIPLGGGRAGTLRTSINLCVVFLLCGLWHGASWTFLIWGAYHGAFLAAERLRFGVWIDRLPRLLRQSYCILVVMIGWVFFRSDSLQQAMTFLAAMAGKAGSHPWPELIYKFATPDFMIALAIGMLFSQPVFPWLRARCFTFDHSAQAGVATRQFVVSSASACAYWVLFILCSCALAAGTHNPFIYFRF